MRYRKYDEEEKALILQIGDNYPQNLMEGCRELAIKLDRNPKTIQSQYYYLKRKENKYSFVLTSKKKIIPDRKIVKQNCPIKPINNKSTLWKKFLKLIGLN